MLGQKNRNSHVRRAVEVADENRRHGFDKIVVDVLDFAGAYGFGLKEQFQQFDTALAAAGNCRMQMDVGDLYFF